MVNTLKQAEQMLLDAKIKDAQLQLRKSSIEDQMALNKNIIELLQTQINLFNQLEKKIA